MLIPISYPLNRETPLSPPGRGVAGSPSRGRSLRAGRRSPPSSHRKVALAPAQCIGIPKAGGEPIRIHDLLPHLDVIRGVRALFIRDPGAGTPGRATRRPTREGHAPGSITRCRGSSGCRTRTSGCLGSMPYLSSPPQNPRRARGPAGRSSAITPDLPDRGCGPLLRPAARRAWVLRLYPVVFDDLEAVPVVALAGF